MNSLELAQAILDRYAISPDFTRSGEQIKALLIEAVELALFSTRVYHVTSREGQEFFYPCREAAGLLLEGEVLHVWGPLSGDDDTFRPEWIEVPR